MKVCVIGLWHQGIVGAACLAECGYDVIAADHLLGTIETLKFGKAPLYEPGLDDMIQKGILLKRLTFTNNVAAAVRGVRDVLLMFDTPVNDNDESDLSEIMATAREIAPHLEQDVVILVTAQVPIGTCSEIAGAIGAVNRGLKFGIAYMPENLRLGQAIDRFKHPPLPVIGSDDAETLNRVAELLKPLRSHWERVNLRTAEMTKHALNGFLATSITFANELGNLCDEMGADGHRLAEVLRLEPRVGTKAMLTPGLGFAGGTLARDIQTLRKLGDRHGVETPQLDGTWKSNQQQNHSVIHRLRKAVGGSLGGRRVCVLGLTYKADTSTLRRSAALEIISELSREGAVVTGSDPKADRSELKDIEGFTFFENPYEAASGTEAVILMTPWQQYRDLNFEELRARMNRPIIVDTANLWPGDDMIRRGFEYYDIGRGRKVKAS